MIMDAVPLTHQELRMNYKAKKKENKNQSVDGDIEIAQ